MCSNAVCTDLQVATGFGRTTPAVYTAWNIPFRLTRLVISLIRTGATRFARSFLCTHRKLISTTCCFLSHAMKIKLKLNN